MAMNEHDHKVMVKVSQAALYVEPGEGNEAISISHWDSDPDDEDYEGAFWGTGEESGNEYKIFYKEVDLDTAMFYKLVLMD